MRSRKLEIDMLLRLDIAFEMTVRNPDVDWRKTVRNDFWGAGG